MVSDARGMRHKNWGEDEVGNLKITFENITLLTSVGGLMLRKSSLLYKMNFRPCRQEKKRLFLACDAPSDPGKCSENFGY